MEVAKLFALPFQVIAVFLASTVAFDIVHFTLHAFCDSRFALLRSIGSLHATHHAFLDRNLDVHEDLLRSNLLRHVIPEYATQVSFSLALLWLVPPAPVIGALCLQTLVFGFILRDRGMDVNHRPIASLRAYRPMFFCLPPYHGLHHAFPDAHFSSWIKLFDHIAGSGTSFQGRRVAMTGAESPFGAALARELECREGLIVLRLAHGPDRGSTASPDFAERLRDVDILVLAHGCQDSQDSADHGASYVAAIECFARIGRGRKLPIEVWAAGAQDGGRARADDAHGFARHARRYYFDDRVIYRHLARAPIGSASRSGLLPRRAARLALFFVRRGFNFVPVSRSGLVVLDYFLFRYAVRPAEAP